MGKRSRSSVSAPDPVVEPVVEPIVEPDPITPVDDPIVLARPDESTEEAGHRLSKLLAARSIPSAKLGLPDDASAPYVVFRLGAFVAKTAAGQIGIDLGADAVTAEVAIEVLARP